MKHEMSETEISLEHTAENNIKKNPDANRVILFLDFDGVINISQSTGSLIRSIFKGNADAKKLCSPRAMKNLNLLAAESHAQIVISSSWRHIGIDYCKSYLYDNGLNTSVPVIGALHEPCECVHSRSDLIAAWLRDDGQFTDYIILDNADMPDLKNHLVLTDNSTGLTEQNVEEAKEILRFHGLNQQ